MCYSFIIILIKFTFCVIELCNWVLVYYFNLKSPLYLYWRIILKLAECQLHWVSSLTPLSFQEFPTVCAQSTGWQDCNTLRPLYKVQGLPFSPTPPRLSRAPLTHVFQGTTPSLPELVCSRDKASPKLSSTWDTSPNLPLCYSGLTVPHHSGTS